MEDFVFPSPTNLQDIFKQQNLTGIKQIPFNTATPSKLFIDINSCFATVEQQYNPSLRGKPLAIAAYAGPTGCVIASSIEAKKLGIKTGIRVNEAKKIFPKIIVMEPDPPKYRTIHKKLKEVLYTYTPLVTPHSIDEFCIDIENTPTQRIGAVETALKIKQDIKAKVGDWITVSIGIAPNVFLAKTASNLQKPDGLKTIDSTNFLQIFTNLALTDLCGVKSGNSSRLATQEIFTVLDFYNADIKKLCQAFKSIEGYYWHLKIRGWDLENPSVNTFAQSGKKKSFGNSFAVPGNLCKKADLVPILYKLVEKTAVRLRREGYKTKKISLNILYRDGTHWKDHKNLGKYVDQTAEIYKALFRLLTKCPHEKPVRILAEYCFDVAQTNEKQLDLFESLETSQKKEGLGEVIDKINQKYGDMTVSSAELIRAKKFAPDRIGFGK